MHFKRLCWLWSLAAIVVAGCAPVYQDARMLGPGRLEVTPSFSGNAVIESDEIDYGFHSLGVNAQFGVADRFDVGLGYARLEDVDFRGGLNSFGFGPKFGIVADRFAISVPVGFLFGDEVPTSETWQIQPTALFTLPLNDRVDFNPSTRVIIGLCERCDTLVGINGGFGIRAVSRVTLRPELGIVFNPTGEGDLLWTFGLGVSLRNR
jgi:hypothetical protein